MSGPPPPNPAFHYVPAPHERAYYGVLFNTADSERQGSIQGAKAVEFFSRSKLPLPKLKEIWIVADQPPTNALDPRKFAVAVRLIQLEQNGIRPTGPDLAACAPPNIRPAFFEGIPPPPPPSASFDGGAAQPGAPPPRHPVPGAPQPLPPPSNTQLVVHAADPYAMTPAEQARYEAIFPEYANKEDPDFLHGEDAFGLFNKSGLPSQQLAAIWAMVDVPVDNKLDKLEFAMAMHLIVCVSKKNLPCPTALPQSLQQLKAQMPPQSQPGEVPRPMSPPRPMAQTQPMMGGPPPLASHMRSPSNVSSVGGGPMMAAGGGAFPSSSASSGGMMMQPPIQQQQQQPNAFPSSASTGGMPSPGRMNMGGGPPSYVNPPTMPSMVMTRGPSNVMSSSASTGGIPSPVRTMGGPPAFVNSTSNNNNNMQSMVGPPPLQTRTVNISDAFEGLGHSADTGSISSFRATSPVVAATGHFSSSAEEDPPARSASPPPPPKTSQQLAANYDLGETSEELKKLRATLQKLQAENIALKAQLGTMGDEEKDLQKELGATIAEITKLSNELTTMRAQVLASKSRLLDAASELKAAKEKKGVISDLISEARATKEAIDEAHRGVESAIAQANAAMNSAPPPASLINEADFFGGGAWGNDASTSAPLPGETHNKYALNNENGDASTAPNSIQQSSSYPVEQKQSKDSAPSYSFIQTAISPAPAKGPGEYEGGGYHNRNYSNTSDFGEAMGSGPTPLHGISSAPFYGNGDTIPNVPSLKEIEDLKSKSREADELARDAESTKKQLEAQLDELRRIADDAETKSREASSPPSAVPPKKKGFLGRGGAPKAPKKKDVKEAERLALDARQKKEAMLQVQAQLKDAEALAKATKEEAEKLHKEAETIELKAAQAASMQHNMPVSQNNMSSFSMDYNKSSMPPPQPDTNGFGAPMGSGGTVGIVAAPPLSGGTVGMVSAPPTGDNFNPNVMGSGGTEIPVPAGFDDPYSNPFE